MAYYLAMCWKDWPQQQKTPAKALKQLMAADGKECLDSLLPHEWLFPKICFGAKALIVAHIDSGGQCSLLAARILKKIMGSTVAED